MKFLIAKAAVCVAVATAMSPSAQATSSNPAKTFIATKHSIRQPLLQVRMLANVLQDPTAYKGRAVELTGDVMGAVVSGDVHTVLLNASGSEISAIIPAKFNDADWMQPGQKVRVLLSVEAPASAGAPEVFRMMDAAPEYDVANAEAVPMPGWTRINTTSRSVAYVRDPGYGVTSSVEAGVVPTAVSAGNPVCQLSPSALRVYGSYYTAIRQLNSNLTESEANKITSSVLYFSELNDVDPRLPIAMIIAESGFDINSTSRTGAMGLGQLMPSTAAGMGVTDAYDPVQNIGAAVKILRGNLDKYGGAPSHAGEVPYSQIRLVMAAYNAGPGAVKKYHGVPPYRETQRYVVKVGALYKALCGK